MRRTLRQGAVLAAAMPALAGIAAAQMGNGALRGSDYSLNTIGSGDDQNGEPD